MWINLFEQPDALSQDDIEAHEDFLRSECHYAGDNLDTLKNTYTTCAKTI